MGVIHKCLLGAAAVLALSCQPRWVNSASYQFANNTQLVQNDVLLKDRQKNSGTHRQELRLGDRTMVTHFLQFSLDDGRIEKAIVSISSSPSYVATISEGLLEIQSLPNKDFITELPPKETHSLPAGPLYHPVMATHYPLVVDAIWTLKVGEERLLSMVQPPKGNISVASYYLAQKTTKERIYLYRNDSNVGTLTYQKHKGRWVLQKVDLMNQDMPYVWERMETP